MDTEVRPLPPAGAVPFYVVWAIVAFWPLGDPRTSPSRTSVSLRRLLLVTAVVHMCESIAAFGRARKIGRHDEAWAWATSTFLWGVLSAVRLYRIEADPS